jgi:hypothetical protein
MENAGIDESTQAHQSFLMFDWNLLIFLVILSIPDTTCVTPLLPLVAAMYTGLHLWPQQM